MRNNRDFVVPRPSLTAPKCKALRPLKTKIVAVAKVIEAERNLTKPSNSARLGGLMYETMAIRSRRLKTSDSNDDNPDSSDPAIRLRKYGQKRKNKVPPMADDREEMSPEHLLESMRSTTSGQLGQAYRQVYDAFNIIYQRLRPKRKFPSLGTRAAYAVAKSIYLTSDAFTETPIEAEDWYEAVPEHFRSDLLLSHAVDTIVQNQDTLRPLLPVIACVLKDSILSRAVMSGILEMTPLRDCRKSDLQQLQRLADAVHMPWAVKIHFSQELQVEDILGAAFSYLLDLKSEGIMDNYTQALYFKSTTLALESLSQKEKHDSDADLRLIDVLERMSQRVFRSREAWILPALQALFQQAVSAPCLEHITLGYSLAVLPTRLQDEKLIAHLQFSADKLSKSAGSCKDECLTYLGATMSQESLKEIVECLVGRIDDLAMILARMCAETFASDFISWASKIESSIFSNKNESGPQKYRYEPLLDSWIGKTPGVSKTTDINLVEDSVAHGRDETENEQSYDADISQSQSSFMANGPEDEDELTMSLRRQTTMMPSNVLDLLSAPRSTDLLQSAKLIRRYGRPSATASHVGECSPLQRMQANKLKPLICDPTEYESPTRKRGHKKRARELSFIQPLQVAQERSKRLKRERTSESDLALLGQDFSSSLPRISLKGQRELKKLKCFFISGLRRKEVSRKAIDSGAEADVDGVNDCHLTTDVEHYSSDYDELTVF